MKQPSVYYLSVSDVLDIHEAVLIHGEDPGVLKPGELDAAILAVQATFDEAPLLGTLAEVAAAYVFYLNRSHVFMDGNKRTSLVTALLFLEANGFKLDTQKTDWLLVVAGVVAHRVSQADLVVIFAEAMGTPGEIEW